MKKTLNLDALQVSSFATNDDVIRIPGMTTDPCTGCDSTCGITGYPPDQDQTYN